MTEKLKVNHDIANALNHMPVELSTSEILKIHADNPYDWYNELKPLMDLKLEELATALIVGYEVELTPHEQIATIYNHHYSKFHHVEHKAEKYFSKGYVKGIRFTLEKLGITIEGVNDK